MQLSDLMVLLTDLSGRNDLDNTALLRYLNLGQRLLDELSEFAHAPAEFITQLSQGDFYVRLVNRPKVITNVILYDSTNTQKELKHIDLKELRILNPTLIGSREQGIPDFYALGNVRRVPEGATATLTAGSGIIETGETASYTSIIFDTPINQDYVAEVIGKFYTDELDLADLATKPTAVKETWWTLYYFDLVITAARYKMDVDLQNTEGMVEKLKILQVEINEITNNTIEQEIVGISAMKG